MQDAISIAHGMIATYEDQLPKLTKFLNDNLGDVMTFLAFPKRHHRKIHSTNVLERFNKEVKRRTKYLKKVDYACEELELNYLSTCYSL